MSFDTIAAISTPRGKGGVALIRISGSDAAAIADKIFIPKNKKAPSELEERRAIFGDICDPRDGRTIDSGLCVIFRAPRSFTGEDSAEISCHGGVLVSAAVLSAAISAGARQAEAGEFTRRAYAAGKLSLPEAEALGMLLEARTDAQMRMAHGGMSGRLSRAAAEISDEVSAVLSDIYARIDFPDEDLGELEVSEIEARLCATRRKLAALLATYRTGRAIAEGIPTVICGRTNAGKSTLYNRMAGEELAIVTSEAGTTRDVLTETVSFGGLTLRLSDTAGIREGRDTAERVGIDRARDKIAESELVFFVLDGSREPNDDERDLAATLAERQAGHVVAVLTKADLTGGTCGAHPAALELWQRFEPRASISAADGSGMEELAAAASGLYIDPSVSFETDAVVQNERQRASLDRAAAALDDALTVIADGFSPDIAGVDLEEALSALREVDGRGICAEIVDGIFSKFCVGK